MKLQIVVLDQDIYLFISSCYFMQIAFTSVVYPALTLAYMGQAAYLSQHHVIESDYRIGFYVSVPGRHTNYYFFRFLQLFMLLAWSLYNDFFFFVREIEVACSSYSYTCSCGGKPSCYYCNLFNHQAVFCFGMFPKGENSSHIIQNLWPNIHTRYQLDLNDAMFGCHNWFQRYEAFGKRLRYEAIIGAF